MHTTLYRSLALLVSIFALTSSFSLSTENERDSTNVHDIQTQQSNNTTGTKGQSSWIFECTYDRETFFIMENAGSPVEAPENNITLIDKDSFQKKLTSHSELFNLISNEQPYCIFRIYKEGQKNKIIGIILKNKDGEGKLMLYDNEFKHLNNGYTESIKDKTLILKQLDFGPFFHSLSKGQEEGYVLGMQWKEETNETEKTSITLFYDKQSNMKIQKGLAIPGPDRSMGRKSTSREKWKKILLGCAFLGICIYIIYKLYIHIYNQGCFSKKSSQRKPGR